MEGTIKWYSREKGYGFIKGDDGTDYFFHHTALGEFRPRGEERVTFKTEQGDRGPKAVNVVSEKQQTLVHEDIQKAAAETHASTETSGREEGLEESETEPVTEDEPVAETVTTPEEPAEEPPEKFE